MDYPSAVLEVDEIHAAARTLGLEARTVAIRNTHEIPFVFETLTSRTDALFFPLIRSLTATAFASTLWHSALDCRRCSRFGSMWKREA